MQQVILSKEKPPVYDALHSKFGVEWDDGIIIAYDGKIYCKMGVQPQKVIHESVHLERQKQIGNDTWWKLYLESDQFRREEEILAYLAECQFLRKNIKNREHVFHMIREICTSISDGTYGNIITKEEALKILM